MKASALWQLSLPPARLPHALRRDRLWCDDDRGRPRPPPAPAEMQWWERTRRIPPLGPAPMAAAARRSASAGWPQKETDRLRPRRPAAASRIQGSAAEGRWWAMMAGSASGLPPLERGVVRAVSQSEAGEPQDLLEQTCWEMGESRR